MIKKAFHLAIKSYGPLLKSGYGLLIPLWIFSALADQYFGYAGKLAKRGSLEQIMAQVGQTTSAILVSFVLLLFIPVRLADWQSKRPYQSWVQIVSRYGWPLFVEGLRMTGYILLWSILFILPGLYKQIRYLFVPFVVLFDSLYHRGEVDALDRSSQLSKGIFWALLFLFMASFGVDILFDMKSQFLPVLAHPVFQFLGEGVNLLISTLFYSLFYFLFSLKLKASSETSSDSAEPRPEKE